MISPTTFETTFRQRLLDIVYAQWAALGAPFSERDALNLYEVIDPEALLWCSLEFLPSEPRLAETVLEWLGENGHYIVRQRVCRRSARKDARTILWDALDSRLHQPWDIDVQPPPELCEGLEAWPKVVECAHWIRQHRSRGEPSEHRLGNLQWTPATLLLRARDLIGQDVRHFLLVYLLTNPHGGKLRDAEEWSGYSYRSLASAAASWVSADVATLDSGYCRLNAPDPWRALLQIRTSRIVIPNWSQVFEVSVRLLRDLKKARAVGIGHDSPAYAGLKREAATGLDSALKRTNGTETSTRPLLRCLANSE